MMPGDSLPDPMSTRSAAPRGLGCLAPLGLVMALGIVVVGIGMGALLGWLARGPSAAPAPSVRVIRSQPSVVTAVRELSRLEGAEFHIERVIELTEKQRRLFGLVEAEDAILLVAAGEVVAGVDLSRLGESDVQVDRAQSTVTLRLPAPEVFYARLDNERTYVHTRKTDVLARRAENLETAARREAESTLASAAKEANITTVAERSVRRTVEGLVRALGYERVTVEFAPAAPSETKRHETE